MDDGWCVMDGGWCVMDGGGVRQMDGEQVYVVLMFQTVTDRDGASSR